VKNGLVDYTALKAGRADLDTYLNQLPPCRKRICPLESKPANRLSDQSLQRRHVAADH